MIGTSPRNPRHSHAERRSAARPTRNTPQRTKRGRGPVAARQRETPPRRRIVAGAATHLNGFNGRVGGADGPRAPGQPADSGKELVMVSLLKRRPARRSAATSATDGAD